jgi:hypothetical protein
MRRIFGSIWFLISAGVVILGTAAAAVVFLPRVTISAGDPVDPGNPFSASLHGNE